MTGLTAVVLAGGHATRLRPLTEDTPKAVVPLLNRPFIEHVVLRLRDAGVSDVCLALGHLADEVLAELGDGSDVGVRVHVNVEREPAGSAGALRPFTSLLGDPFLVCNGDVFTTFDPRQATRALEGRAALAAIHLVEVDDPSGYGVVELAPDGHIARFVEKPPPAEAPSRMANAGTWAFRRAALEHLPTTGHSMLETGLFPALAAAGLLLGVPSDAYWVDAGTVERYLQLHYDLLLGRAASVARPRGRIVQSQSEVWNTPALAARVAVHPHAAVEGPVLLGDGCRIGAGALVRGPTALGPDVIVHDGAYVEASVVWQGARIGAQAEVIASVLGWNAVVGQGARLERCALGTGAQVPPGRTLVSAREAPS